MKKKVPGKGQKQSAESLDLHELLENGLLIETELEQQFKNLG